MEEKTNISDLDVIFTRRSTRNFSEREVEKTKIEKIVLAGQHAPTGRNRQKNHFIVIQNKNIITDIAKLVKKEFLEFQKNEKLAETYKDYIEVAKNENYVFHYNPDLFIVVATEKEYSLGIQDASCALENMMICANALDLGSCWINQLYTLRDNENIRKFLIDLGMNENEFPVGCLSVGYPDGELKRNLKNIVGNEVNYIW